MSYEEYESRIAAQKEEYEALQAEVTRILDASSDAQEKLEAIYTERFNKKIEDGYYDLESLDSSRYKELMFDMSSSGFDAYRKGTAILRGIHPSIMYDGSTYGETQQPVWRVMLLKDQEIDSDLVHAVQRVNNWLADGWDPAMDNTFFWTVFERTLSAGGTYSLVMTGDGTEAQVRVRVYGLEDELTEFVPLEEALDYVAKNHWYGEPEEPEEESEDD